MLRPKIKTTEDQSLEQQIRHQLKQAGFDEKGNPEPEQNLDTDHLKLEHNPKPPITAAIKDKQIDGRFIRLTELPSNFLVYDRDHLLIRPFSVLELKLIARSIESNNIDYITQAIDNCIDMDVYELTIPDYFYLYYWLRIESYPNTPYYLDWTCDELKDDSTCGHRNTTPLTKAELKIIYLSDLGFTPAQLDPRLDFPRVRLLEDLTIGDNEKKERKLKQLPVNPLFTPDQLMLLDAAKWVKEGKTIFDKIAHIEAQPNLDLYEVANRANVALAFGVYEYTLVTCGGCGATRRFRVLLDAPKFFPFFD